ncbi:MAG: bifunctional (p)ppGpp synthetase/guanosine-3',5'-bis(diphosphate) 3'-pyrophosphohydrolase [Thermodesulfobacteriota bacterium]
MPSAMTAPALDTLVTRLREYHPQADPTPLAQALDWASRLPPIPGPLAAESSLDHGLAVSKVLVAMKLDVASVAAGLLHDLLERRPELLAEAREAVGPEAAQLLAGLPRMPETAVFNRLEHQAETVRKMFVAMSQDIRVLLIRLADHLHVMRTLDAYPAEVRPEIARETLDLFAPLAYRLGIDWVKRDLEDLAFRHLHPEAYADLAARVESASHDREIFVQEILALLDAKLREHQLEGFRLLGRPKHLYSIYRKLQVQKIPLEKVYDKVAFRIIFPTVEACYAALGMVHSLWPMVPARFKDFISKPKANGYRSLHTSVIGPRGEFMEIQIRTEEMDQVAREGIAAHWAYKEKKAISSQDANVVRWLKQMVQIQQDLADPREVLDSTRQELYTYEVYVITPNGEVKELPAGSTPIDFAYSIHTEVGHRCTGAKVNGRIVPLRYQLQNGDRVEILTSPHQKPSRDWLAFIKTGRARARIRQWLNAEEQERLLDQGREILERELRRVGQSLKRLRETGHLDMIREELGQATPENLFRAVAAGKVPVASILDLLVPPEVRKERQEEAEMPVKGVPSRADTGEVVIVDGIADMPVKISRCCTPLPGDAIMGFITTGRGVSVHKPTCPNYLASEPARRIGVRWPGQRHGAYRAQILLFTQNRKGMLAQISQTISADDANILDLTANSRRDGTAVLRAALEVAHLDQLRAILDHLRQLDGVLEARRE